MKSNVLLDSYLKALKLPTFLREYRKIARQCAQDNKGYEEFLQHISELEIQERERKSTARRIRQAGFPAQKDLSDFEFAAVPKLNKKRIFELTRCDYIEKRENIVFAGEPGTGKTHLAIALGREACRRGRKVKFFTAAGLATAYAEARTEREVQKLERYISKCHLVIVDELGYVPLGKASEDLFNFFSQCYERTSLIVTTNLPFSEWPQVFGDERLTGALLDRLTHRVHVVEVQGESYRFKSSRKKKEEQEGGEAAKDA